MNSISSVLPSSLPSAPNSGLATSANGILTTPLLDLTQANLMAQAGAAVIRTSNAMLGTLLDVFA